MKPQAAAEAIAIGLTITTLRDWMPPQGVTTDVRFLCSLGLAVVTFRCGRSTGDLYISPTATPGDYLPTLAETAERLLINEGRRGPVAGPVYKGRVVDIS